jgi:hypothetical protein
LEFNYKLNTFAKILKVVHSQCLQKVIEMGVLVLVGRVDWSLTYSKPFSYIVSVFYCYITNYHKFSILKQQTFTNKHLLWFQWVKSPGRTWLGSLLGTSKNYNEIMSQG